MSTTGTVECAYCLAPVEADEARCPECGARFHADCWVEYGGCTVFGCTDWMARQMVGAAPPQQLAAPVGLAPPQPGAPAPAFAPPLPAAAAASTSASPPPPVVPPPAFTDSLRDVETPPAGIRRPIAPPVTSNDEWWNA